MTMNKRFWRDLIASPDHGLWRGAIPVTDKENFFSDVVHKLAQAEEDEEKLGELLVAAARQGRVNLEPTEADKTGKGRVGRPSKLAADCDMLREIRATTRGSDGQWEFKTRLTQNPNKDKRIDKTAAQRRYRKAAEVLATENPGDRND
jgi:hypothetical protein